MDVFQTLKALLTQPTFTPATLDLRESICVLANQAFNEITAAGPEGKARAKAAFQPFTAGAARHGNAFLLTIAHGLLHAATGEAGHLRAAIEAALGEDAADVGVGMNNIYLLSRLDFINTIGFGDLAGIYDYEARHRHWLKLVDLAEAAAASAKVRRKTRFTPNDRVLILIDQFVQPPHAPSKDALDYAKMFQAAGKQVMIISTCAYGRQLYSAIMPGSRGSLIEGLGSATALEFEGRTFAYHQPASGRFNNATLAESFAAIEAFDPAFVLVVGGQNMVGELLARRSFLVQYPTFAGLPTTRNFRFFTWREPTMEERALLARLGLERNHLFSHHPGFEPPLRTTHLTRGQFGIPAEAFVFAIVGMRLDLDVTEDFIAVMRDIQFRRPAAHFVFVGDFDPFQDRIGADPALAGGATHIGFQSDIMAAYELCDAYINPTRKGGGSAIVHALTAGLPALSVNFGDAYEAVRDFPPIEDYAALTRIACDLADRGETYEAYVREVREKSPALRGKAAVMEGMLAAYDRFLCEQDEAG